MKKIKLIIFLILITLIFISAGKITIAYTSNPTLYYDGNSFRYINVKNDDLFVNFKDLMPGDIKTQSIDINLNEINNDSKLYLKLYSNEFLNKLNFKIYKDNDIIFDNLINNEDYNTPIIIYNTKDSKNFQLKMDLKIPVELGNEIEEIDGSFRWQFLIEDYEEIKEVPKTIDNLYGYFITMCFSLIILIAILIKYKKNS